MFAISGFRGLNSRAPRNAEMCYNPAVDFFIIIISLIQFAMTKFRFLITRAFVARTLIVVGSAFVLVSCASSPQTTHDDRQGKSPTGESLFSKNELAAASNDYRANLELPPDLLGSANEKVKRNVSGGTGEGINASDVVGRNKNTAVLPKSVSVTIKRNEKQSWLEINTDAKVVWERLSAFWSFQEIGIGESQPQAGLLETDWFAEAADKESLGFSNLFNKKRAKRDKFIIRLERDGANGTKLFVTHRYKQKEEINPNSQAKVPEFDWVEGDSDPEKVAKLFQSIALLFDSNWKNASGNEPS